MAGNYFTSKSWKFINPQPGDKASIAGIGLTYTSGRGWVTENGCSSIVHRDISIVDGKPVLPEGSRKNFRDHGIYL